MMRKLILGILFTICAVSIMGCSKSKGVYTSYPSNTIKVAYDQDNNRFVLNNSGEVIKEISHDEKPYSRYNLTRNVLLMELDESFYIFHNDKMKKIDDKIFEVAISDNGNTVFYKTREESNFCLKIYDVTKDKAKTIRKIERDEHISDICISPDGKTVAYSISKDSKTEGFISVNNKKPVSIGEVKTLFAVSNEGKFVYYTDEEYTLYVKSGNTTNEIGHKDSFSTMCFNKDYSELLFSDDETYIILDGAKPIQLSDRSHRDSSLVVPDATVYGEVFGGSFRSHYVCGIDSFSDKHLLSDNKMLYYINKDFEAIEVIDDVRTYGITSSNEFFVIDYDSIYKVIKDDYDEILAVEGGSIFVPKSGSGFYHIYDNELFYIKGDKEPSLLSKDVKGAMLMKGDTLYYFVEGKDGDRTLHSSKNGGAGKKIKNGDNVNKILSFEPAYRPYFSKESDGQMNLYTISGNELKLIIENYK